MEPEVTGTEPQIENPDPGELPVVQGEEAKQEPQEAEGEKKVEPEPDRDDKGRFKGVQPRIDELTRKHREAEREAAYWRGVAEAKKPAESAPAAAEKPKKDDFESYEDFVEALTDYKARQIANAAVAEAETKRTAKTAEQTRQDTWNTRQEEARKVIPDYDEVVASSNIPIANHVGAELLENEHGPALAHHIALHPEVAEKLNSLSPRQVVREIARLETEIAKTAPAKTGSPAKTPSKAPAPGSHVKPGAATNVDLSKVSMDDYVATRKKQGADWAY